MGDLLKGYRFHIKPKSDHLHFILPSSVCLPAAPAPRQTVFARALKAGELRWSDPHLQKVLNGETAAPGAGVKNNTDKLSYDPQGRPLWLGDHFPVACARVDALRSHGYPQQALRLAVSVVNTMRLQRQHQMEGLKQQRKGEHGGL